MCFNLGSGFRARLALFIVLLVGAILALTLLSRDRLKTLGTILEEDKGGLGVVLFFALSVVAITLLVPGPFVALLAGALYGKLFGWLIIWIASILLRPPW